MATVRDQQSAARIAWSLTRSVNPSNRCVDLAFVKRSLRLSVQDDSHDETLYALIDAATEQVEHDTASALITQGFVMNRDAFPTRDRYVYIPIRPIQSIASVTYTDTDSGASVAFTDYTLDAAQQMIVLTEDAEWPTNASSVVITLTVGYGDAFQAVPNVLRQAVTMQTGRWFQNPTMDLNDLINTDAPYNRLIARYLRASYP